MRGKAAALLVFLSIGANAGCGPVEYITQVTRTAANAVSDAKAAGAEAKAPYEYTSAVEYLHKAREEEGHADHQAAVRFGRLATEMALKAKELADKTKAGSEAPGPASQPTPGGAAPVKDADVPK